MPEAGRADVAEIVKSAFEHDASERARYLDQACGLDTDLRAEVESLLSFGAHVPRFMDEPAVHLAAELLAGGETLETPDRLGQYEICSLIGSGGMGEVYLAQDTTLGRKVALKLVKSGLGTATIIRHFHQEERILAGLNHPHIARLYGGGVTPNGLPYFIMEYVEGERLDEYCNSRSLTTHERLNLFRKVCLAVTYAHQNLVIHRDLKPANIRVTAEGEPKLLDFGIAKLIESENGPTSGVTITLQAVMTPEYASPEQVAGDSITTASDVYSLGVILYRLLTGRSPYRTKTNRPDEIARAITEEDPERPSTAMGRNPASDFGLRTSKFLRGDLDNIILMAMRKEPARRYASVAQFSEDIRRHLDGVPVVARKDTFVYRATKFVGRNRLEVSAGTLVVLALLAALIISWRGAENARQQRDVARRESAKAERINQFLHRMLSFSNQSITSVSPVAQKKDVTVNAMLDQITPQIEAELAGEPEVRAQIFRTIGSAYASQGQYDSAEKNLRAALETQRVIGGEDSPEVAATSAELGLLSLRQGKVTEANRLLESAVAFYRKQRQQKAPDFSPLKLAQALDSLGITRFFQGDRATAISLLDEALQLASGSSLKQGDRAVLAGIKTDLGGILVWDSPNLAKGETLLREALAEFRQISGPPRWELGATLTLLGSTAIIGHQLDEAEKFFAEGEQIYRQALGDKNAYLGFNLDQQAALFFQKNNLKMAEEKARESLAIVQAVSFKDKQTFASPMWKLGEILTKAGRPQEGEEFLRQALALFEQQVPKPPLARLRVGLSESLLAQSRLPEAEEAASQAYEEAKRTLDKNDLLVKQTATNLVKIYEAEGKTDAAQRLREDNR